VNTSPPIESNNALLPTRSVGQRVTIFSTGVLFLLISLGALFGRIPFSEHGLPAEVPLIVASLAILGAGPVLLIGGIITAVIDARRGRRSAALGPMR
jgi:hypothetical protein